MFTTPKLVRFTLNYCCDLFWDLFFPPEYHLDDFSEYNIVDLTTEYKIDCPYLDKVLVLTDYKLVHEPVFKYKYRHHRYLAKIFANTLATKFNQFSQLENTHKIVLPELITFCPADPKRLTLRGYNPAELICTQFGEKLNLTIINIFSKVKSTKSQTNLTRNERLNLNKNIFKLNVDQANHKKLIEAKSIIIFDDVITTGSTLNNLAKQLKNQYPHIQITGLAFAGNPFKPVDGKDL